MKSEAKRRRDERRKKRQEAQRESAAELWGSSAGGFSKITADDRNRDRRGGSVLGFAET
jgi:hypothetical protein